MLRIRLLLVGLLSFCLSWNLPVVASATPSSGHPTDSTSPDVPWINEVHRALERMGAKEDEIQEVVARMLGRSKIRNPPAYAITTLKKMRAKKPRWVIADLKYDPEGSWVADASEDPEAQVVLHELLGQLSGLEIWSLMTYAVRGFTKVILGSLVGKSERSIGRIKRGARKQLDTLVRQDALERLDAPADTHAHAWLRSLPTDIEVRDQAPEHPRLVRITGFDMDFFRGATWDLDNPLTLMARLPIPHHWPRASEGRRVFLSCATADQDLALAVRDILEHDGYSVFVHGSEHGASRYDSSLAGMMFAQSDLRIVIDSRHARGSPEVFVNEAIVRDLATQADPGAHGAVAIEMAKNIRASWAEYVLYSILDWNLGLTSWLPDLFQETLISKLNGIDQLYPPKLVEQLKAHYPPLAEHEEDNHLIGMIEDYIFDRREHIADLGDWIFGFPPEERHGIRLKRLVSGPRVSHGRRVLDLSTAVRPQPQLEVVTKPRSKSSEDRYSMEFRELAFEYRDNPTELAQQIQKWSDELRTEMFHFLLRPDQANPLRSHTLGQFVTTVETEAYRTNPYNPLVTTAVLKEALKSVSANTTRADPTNAEPKALKSVSAKTTRADPTNAEPKGRGPRRGPMR